MKAGQHAQHDATILAHLSTVDSVARRLAGGRYDFDDLRSVAYLALVRAVSDYRPDRGVGGPATRRFDAARSPRWSISALAQP